MVEIWNVLTEKNVVRTLKWVDREREIDYGGVFGSLSFFIFYFPFLSFSLFYRKRLHNNKSFGMKY